MFGASRGYAHLAWGPGAVPRVRGDHPDSRSKAARRDQRSGTERRVSAGAGDSGELEGLAVQALDGTMSARGRDATHDKVSTRFTPQRIEQQEGCGA